MRAKAFDTKMAVDLGAVEIEGNPKVGLIDAFQFKDELLIEDCRKISNFQPSGVKCQKAGLELRDIDNTESEKYEFHSAWCLWKCIS